MYAKEKQNLNKKQVAWLLKNEIMASTLICGGWPTYRKGLRAVRLRADGCWVYAEARGPTTCNKGNFGEDLKMALGWVKRADLSAKVADHDTIY